MIIKPAIAVQHYWAAVRLFQLSFIRDFRNQLKYCSVDRQLIFCMWFPQLWSIGQNFGLKLRTFGFASWPFTTHFTSM